VGGCGGGVSIEGVEGGDGGGGGGGGGGVQELQFPLNNLFTSTVLL
jgi:hypothetical protein